MGLFTIIAALLACKERDAQPRPAQPVQAASAAPVPNLKAPRTEVSDLARALEAIRANPEGYAASKEVGDKQTTFTLKPIDGVGLATFVGFRGDSQAWRLGLEGIRCERLDDLGLRVVEIERGDGRPLSASWHRIEGGPLDRLLVKSFPGDSPGLCNVMPGTPTYWERQGDKPRNE